MKIPAFIFAPMILAVAPLPAQEAQELVRDVIIKCTECAQRIVPLLETVHDKASADAAATEELRTLVIVTRMMSAPLFPLLNGGVRIKKVLTGEQAKEYKTATRALVDVAGRLEENKYYGSTDLASALPQDLDTPRPPMPASAAPEQDAALCAYFRKLQEATLRRITKTPSLRADIAWEIGYYEKTHTFPTDMLTEEYQGIIQEIRASEDLLRAGLSQLLEEARAGKADDSEINKRHALLTAAHRLRLGGILLAHPHFTVLWDYVRRTGKTEIAPALAE